MIKTQSVEQKIHSEWGTMERMFDELVDDPIWYDIRFSTSQEVGSFWVQIVWGMEYTMRKP